MGGTTFEDYAYGKTPKEAFQSAVEDALHEYGHGGYTGTMAEKGDFIEIPLPSKWAKDPYGYAQHLIEEDDPRISDKWGPAGCILIESKDTMDEVPYATTQERYDQKGARKWETTFQVVAPARFMEEEEVVRSFASQTEAEKFAKDWVKTHNRSAIIRIGKRLVNGQPNIVTIHPKTKQVKSKNPMNKYMFFGWASC